MIATQRFDIPGDDFKSFSPLFVPAQIVDNIVVLLDDYSKGQPT